MGIRKLEKQEICNYFQDFTNFTEKCRFRTGLEAVLILRNPIALLEEPSRRMKYHFQGIKVTSVFSTLKFRLKTLIVKKIALKIPIRPLKGGQLLLFAAGVVKP